MKAANFKLDYNTIGLKGSAETKYIHGSQVNEYVKSKYSIQKLTEIMKAKGFSEQVTLSLGNDLPLQLELKLVTGDGKLEFLLAPRIEND